MYHARNTLWSKFFSWIAFSISYWDFRQNLFFRVMLLSNFQFHLSSHPMPWNSNSRFLLCFKLVLIKWLCQIPFLFLDNIFALLSCDTLYIRAAFILLSMTKSILLWMANAQFHIADDISKLMSANYGTKMKFLFLVMKCFSSYKIND